MASRRLIDSLLSGNYFDHEVKEPQLMETHISWVVLTGKYAYKIKKPVDLGFLDFSLLSSRKHYCEEELRLNQRFASQYSHQLTPSIYLDLVEIGGTEDEPVLNANESIIEYAVKMHQFDQQALVSHLVEADQLAPVQFERLGQDLAQLYQMLDSVDGLMFGTYDAVLSPALENFSTIRPLLVDADSTELIADRIGEIESWTLSTANKLAHHIASRKQLGMVKDCHGDLHTGNIAFIKNKFVLFDCLEFSDAFRVHDVICDLAILLMDLEAKGRKDLSSSALYGYLEKSGDYDALPLLVFYKAYYAMVRAKVSFIRASQAVKEQATKNVNEARLEARRFLELAVSYMQQPKPCLYITCGVSGSGKTTLAKEMLAVSDLVLIRSDVERKRLFGMQAEESSAQCSQNIYSEDATERTFGVLYQTARNLLENELSIIVDGTFLNQELRLKFRQLAESECADFKIIHCHANKSLLSKRLHDREKRGGDASEANNAVMESQLDHFDAFTEEEKTYVVNLDTAYNINLNSLGLD